MANAEDALALRREFAGDRAVEVRQEDGYKVLKAMLPPPERRGLVLIDPPFEATDEFERLSRAVMPDGFLMLGAGETVALGWWTTGLLTPSGRLALILPLTLWFNRREVTQ